MCIISFQLHEHPKYKLAVVANRDEFYDRPTRQAAWWTEHPYILAGKDLRAGGTWMGITKDGKFAALTNYRDLANERPDRKSRGHIVSNYLTSTIDPYTYLEEIHQEKDAYNGFNILLGTVDELYYYNNRQGNIKKIEHGTHTVSNAFLNTPWPKVKKARRQLQTYMKEQNTIHTEDLFTQLSDGTRAADAELPNTGVPLDLERALSSIFIETDGYGTRASTVMLVTKDNKVEFHEKTFTEGTFKEEVVYTFTITK